MKHRIFPALLILLLFSLPAPAVKKDTQVILDEVQRLSAALDQLSAQMAESLKKSGIADEKISAIARNQADLAQSKENFMLSMQFFKEELNALKDSINKLNDRLLNMPVAAVPTAAGAGEPAPRRSRPPWPRILPASITRRIPTTSRKISTWPSRASASSSAASRKADWPTILSTGSASAITPRKNTRKRSTPSTNCSPSTRTATRPRPPFSRKATPSSNWAGRARASSS